MGKKLCVGIRLDTVDDISTIRSEIHSVRYDYLCTNIVYPEATTKLLTLSQDDQVVEPFTFCDLTFTTNEWSSSIVGAISNFSDQLGSENRETRKRAIQLMNHEIDYCQHLCLAAIILDVDPSSFQDVSEIVHSKIDKLYNPKFWIQVPMQVKETSTCNTDSDSITCSGWSIWSKFHAECKFDNHVGLALEISDDIPDEEEIKRWLGEPIVCIVIPTHVFITNAKGFPVLTKAHQTLLLRLFSLITTVLIQAPAPYKPDHRYYGQYIEHLHKQWNEQYQEDTGNAGYDDYLQAPLQPLKDNLESQTYEVFEKDPVKYELYRQAIAKALQAKKSDSKLVVMVVGAGRGPIVTAAIQASKQENIDIDLYALEKNRNAVNTLLTLQRTTWKNEMEMDVRVVHADMRTWKTDVKADIIVSELLGSFGDNELSPECLDGAQKFLKEDGIMIPARYTSFLGPIMSSKLHCETSSIKNPSDKPGSGAHFETPYVVFMKNKYDIDSPKPLFEFRHPNSKIGDNDRFCELHFHASIDSVLHGFAGYFESDLFDGIIMSIYPPTFSEGMFSWYPIFFPIRTPIHLKKGDLITVRFKRCCSERAVWYEWNITSPTILSTHNLKGSAYSIGL